MALSDIEAEARRIKNLHDWPPSRARWMGEVCMFDDALNRIIDDGVRTAQRYYSMARDKPKLDGAILGLEECRGKPPTMIAALLAAATARTMIAFRGNCPDYWFWRCRELEIAWVANVVSNILDAQGRPTIGRMTIRGRRKAAEIIRAMERT